jgi:MFS transporter, AAHS family, 4-hydroxybenzoate transporter
MSSDIDQTVRNGTAFTPSVTEGEIKIMSTKPVSHNKYSISEVIDSFGINKFTWFIFSFLGFAMIFDGYSYMIVSYSMSKIQAEWGLSKLLTGSLTSFSLIGIVIGAVISGIISDKIGRKKTLSISIAVYSLLTIPIFFVHSFSLFAAFSIAAGLGLGACIPTVTTLFSEMTPTKHRSIFITFGMAWMIVGWVVAGLVAQAVIPVLGWRYLFLFAGIPFIYAIIFYIIMPESIYWLVGKGRNKEAVKTIKRFEKFAFGKERHWNPGGIIMPPKSIVTGPKALFTKKYRMVTIGIWIAYFTGTFIIYGINGWLPKIMAEKGFVYIAIASNGAAVIANITTGWLAERIGRKKNLILSYLLSGVAVLFLALSFRSDSFGTLLAAAIFMGFAMNYSITSVQPLMAESYPTEFRNTGVAWGQAFGRIGAIIAPVMAGLIMSLYPDSTDMRTVYSTAFLFFVIPAVIGALGVIIFIQKETKGKSLDQLAEADGK